MERSKAAKREGRRQEDLTVALKGSAIMQKCFLPVAKHEFHSVLQCACDSLHDRPRPITRQKDITYRK